MRAASAGASGSLMLIQDFAIQSTVRRMLVRSNIDYTRITVGTVRGVVYFSGVFKTGGITWDRHEKRGRELTYVDVRAFIKRQHEMAARTLYTLERRVKSVPGVLDVVFQFSNWKKEKGQWVPAKESEKKEEKR